MRTDEEREKIVCDLFQDYKALHKGVCNALNELSLPIKENLGALILDAIDEFIEWEHERIESPTPDERARWVRMFVNDNFKKKY